MDDEENSVVLNSTGAVETPDDELDENSKDVDSSIINSHDADSKLTRRQSRGVHTG